MLFPIGDDNSDRLTTPFVVYAFVAINVVVFLFLQQILQTKSGEIFTYGYSVVPYEITSGEDLKTPVTLRGGQAEVTARNAREIIIPQYPGPSPIWLTILTAMFMHGGWMHIIGNMLYLWIFGDNIEDNFGHFNFAFFYLICGVAATFAQIYVDPTSVIPNLGASGAIAGVLGAYLVMFPKNRVRAIVPLGFFSTITEVPAVVVLGFWIVIQIFSQYTSSVHQRGGGVAYMAHIGGFVTGLVLSFLFRKKRPPKVPVYRRDEDDDYYRPY
ncbi:MAG: rhomboid family intramembrane serine protease [Acidobacteriota bacterium]